MPAFRATKMKLNFVNKNHVASGMGYIYTYTCMYVYIDIYIVNKTCVVNMQNHSQLFQIVFVLQFSLKTLQEPHDLFAGSGAKFA